MKAKIFALVAAFFMLMGGSAWAQSDVKGDVNKDGVVNEQDIAAIIAIMAKNNGVAEKTKYYWYVGQTNPASMTSISPIVSDNSSPGWRLIGTSIPTYSVSNMLWNENKGAIVTGESLAKQYVAIPAKSSACPRDGAGNDASTVAIPLYFGLLSGATLGGNCTPIGASANITSIGMLRRAGYEVKNADFFKIGIPFTLAAIIPAYIYIWILVITTA